MQDWVPPLQHSRHAALTEEPADLIAADDRGKVHATVGSRSRDRVMRRGLAVGRLSTVRTPRTWCPALRSTLLRCVRRALERFCRRWTVRVLCPDPLP